MRVAQTVRHLGGVQPQETRRKSHARYGRLSLDFLYLRHPDTRLFGPPAHNSRCGVYGLIAINEHAQHSLIQEIEKSISIFSYIQSPDTHKNKLICGYAEFVKITSVMRNILDKSQQAIFFGLFGSGGLADLIFKYLHTTITEINISKDKNTPAMLTEVPSPVTISALAHKILSELSLIQKRYRAFFISNLLKY